jgi:hypothetical protein
MPPRSMDPYAQCDDSEVLAEPEGRVELWLATAL